MSYNCFDSPSLTNIIRKTPPPLLIPTSNTTNALKLSIQVPFASTSTSNPPYVLHIIPLTDSRYLIAGSDDTLKVFSSGSLELIEILPVKQKGITSLIRGQGENSRAVFITSRDGLVTGWDSSDFSKEAFRFKAKSGAPYLTCSQSSDLQYLAVGAEIHHHETYIDIYSLTTLTLLRTYSESHSDDITSLSFHSNPSLPHILMSASVDGLINLYDVRIQDEDDALVSTAQVGASLADAGWMDLEGSKGEMKGVWGSTTIETIQFWDLEGSELLGDVGDIRDVCLQPWRSDYLIGVHYNEVLGGVCIFTGTQRGDIAIINLKDPQRWVLEQVLSGAGGRTLGGTGVGHSDIVRCAHLDPKTSNVITGGEDGQICLWTL